jgi:methylglutaconyl-CoA hydratase
MSNLKEIETEIRDKLLTVWLNRPEVLNALNSKILKELTDVFRWVNTRDDIRVVIIRGRGNSFCAGADLKQIAKTGRSRYKKSYADSKKMAACFGMIYGSDKVVINLIHGNVYGGGFGFIGAGDLTIALRNTNLRIPELRLGLVPAVILPYLLTKVKVSDLKYQVFSGEIINAEEALKKGFIEFVCDDMKEMEQKADQIVKNICLAPHDAIADVKFMFRSLSNSIVNRENINKSVKVITRRKLSDETRKRIADFVAKK